VEYLPLFFSLRQSRVLLVGGGGIALRKARLLLAAGAQLTVVSPAIEPELASLLEQAQGVWQQDVYRDSYLDGVTLVVAATPERAVNVSIAAATGSRSIPINVVDNPDLCTFIFPSIVDRSPLVIAIGSGGRSPVLARLIRTKIEALIPATYGRLAAFSGRFRDAIKLAAPTEKQRRRFWEQVMEGPIGEMVLAGQEERAAELVQEYIDSPTELSPIGEVFLVGAGPGDPDLLTFKAVRLLQSADVILYDRLVSPQVLELARRDAERIYVGKRRAEHAVPQQEINQLLLSLAQKGQRVVRLKGGDPFIFGRGGEELELLAANKIPFQVIPGVTAASGCACYAGIPLTHRDYAQSVRFVTAQLQNDRIDLPWDELAASNQTVVFYMGLQGLPTICRQLQASGRAGDTPIALVEQGTTPNQRTLTGTLATMAEIVAEQEVHAPTLIIVGEVVLLHSQLSWWNESVAPASWPPTGDMS
jgi:uroporphyrin-III C-methyltransferase/precorrin-2 dehydrogenase/sirohydrochlorin ferrochelatase